MLIVNAGEAHVVFLEGDPDIQPITEPEKKAQAIIGYIGKGESDVYEVLVDNSDILLIRQV